MKTEYDVIIVGAGIGGLVCGCYLAKKGLRILIVEKHDKPGGYCTSFSRKGYRFDAAVHYLGSAKQGVLGTILKELELQSTLVFEQFDPSDKIILPHDTVYIRANPYDTLKEFKKSFPRSRSALEKFFKFALESSIYSIYSKTKDLTFQEILDEFFKDTAVHAAFSILLANIGTAPQNASALTSVIFFREFIFDPAYYPRGGMQTLPNAIAKEFRKNGGEIVFLKKVKTITTDDNKATGIILEDGATIKSDFVVSNIDASETFASLLNDAVTPEKRTISKLKTSCSVAALFLGINESPKKLLSENCNIWFSDSYDINGNLRHLKKALAKKTLPFGMICFPSTHDPTQQQEKTALQLLVDAPYESEGYWTKNKEAMREKMLAAIKRFVPFADDKLEAMSFATPLTYREYTFNKNGAIYGWESSPSQLSNKLFPQKTSVKNLFIAGHWCTSGVGGEGGISGVANLGRNAARLIANSAGLDWPWDIFILK